jgi:hypothetical protein
MFPFLISFFFLAAEILEIQKCYLALNKKIKTLKGDLEKQKKWFLLDDKQLEKQIEKLGKQISDWKLTGGNLYA